MKTTLLAIALAAVPMLGVPAYAADAHHDHAAAARPLPAGKRWTTDANLRKGMTQIRQAIEPRLGDIAAGKLGAPEYAALAATVDQNVADVVRLCKLPPDADQALHGVLAEIGEASGAMAGKSARTPREGAEQLVKALDHYGRSFAHPGWKPIRG